MTMTTFTLQAEKSNGACEYTVSVEEIADRLVRFTVEAESESSTGFNNAQGVDLSGAECEAIGRHLIAVAERLRATREQ
jgi:hypothetical protein